MKGVGCFYPTFLKQISWHVQKVKANLIQKSIKVHDQSEQVTGKKEKNLYKAKERFKAISNTRSSF